MQVFEQAPVAIAVLRGGDLVYELANPQYRELLNQRPIVGRKLIEVIPELDPHLVGLVREVYKTGVPFVASELQVPLDRDGDGAPEDYWFNLVCHALRERDGDFSGVIVAAHEVTSQVLARAELEKMNHELEEFAYVASHDLQEPLRAVNIYTELLLKRHINSDDGQARKYGEWISGGVRRMEKLILDLLEYSRSIQMEMQAAPIADVSNCIASALGVLKDRITDSGASVDSDVQAIVRADEAQLTQVFQNLIGNALKYRKPGESPRVRIHSRREGGNWIMAVQDNGIGIDSLYKEKIFGLFKRLHGDAYPGTGLGLAICKRIVERFGGRIWVESNKDAGATFYVSLRAVD
jgi:light-regulated signal transduction histidine kinase (bacteriophytochrome)